MKVEVVGVGVLRFERFVVMLPLGLKRALRERARDEGVSMKSVLVRALEGELGCGWRRERRDG